MTEPMPASTTEKRVATLENLVLDLLREVEALRAAMIELSGRQPAALSDSALADEAAGVAGPHTVYGKAYLETAWLTHWSAGPSSGWDKLMAEFGFHLGHEAGREGRELGMLLRLGYGREQVEQYVLSAESAETHT